MTDVLLQASKLYCERDQRILFDGLELSVKSGQLWQIEGGNGAGKTTLLRILAGLSQAYEGELSWCGEPLARVRNNYVGECHYVGHLAGIKGGLTARENLNWYAALAARANADNIDAVLVQLGLAGFEDVPCYTLSAGQQRRVSLARLALLPARLWLLDEPFTAIDSSGVMAIEALISEQLAHGGAVVLTSHQRLQRLDDVQRLVLS